MSKAIPWINKLFTPSGLFIFSTLFANGLNFVFNAYLGRVLTVEDFGLITFINTLVLLMGIFINAFGSAVTHRVAYLITHASNSAGYTFLHGIKKNIFTISLFGTLLWLIFIPVSARFFKIGDIASLLFFTPVITLFLNTIIYRGYLTGSLYFMQASAALIIEALAKLIFAVLLKSLGFENFVYLSIPLSLLAAFLVVYILTKRKTFNMIVEDKRYSFPKRFYAASVISGLSTIGFLSLDLILVKHFLLPKSAGEYALLSLAGKMIFFFGSLFNGLILTYVSRDIGAKINPNKTFYKFLWMIIGITVVSYVGIGLLGSFFMPIAFGAKVNVILPYLREYSLAIALFTIANAFVIYHLARHHYSFTFLSLFSSLLMIVGISVFHSDIRQITQVILAVSLFNFVGIVGLHLIKKNGKFLLRNLIDLVDVFSKQTETPLGAQGKRILIFNWRDTRHYYVGGAEVYIHELAKRWVEMGNRVTVFCGNDGYSPRNEVIDGVQIVRRGGFYFVYFWAFFYYTLRFRGRYDVIIDTENGIPFFTPFYAKEQIYCLMFHVHQEVFTKSLSKPLALLASVLENRVMPWAYKYVKFITISESSKKEMEELAIGNAGIEIVYPGIDLSTFKPAKKSKNPLVIYIGRLQLYKSVNVFINAANEIIQSTPDAEFVIAGDGEQKNSLMKLVNKLNLQNKIKFLGKVTEQEKINLYQKAWVFVNPSLKEGWGITSIEANACGTPVVASDVPGLRDSVQNPSTGYLVSYGDVSAFANKIKSLIKDKDTRQDMEKKSLAWAQKFGWQISAERSLKIIV